MLRDRPRATSGTMIVYALFFSRRARILSLARVMVGSQLLYRAL